MTKRSKYEFNSKAAVSKKIYSSLADTFLVAVLSIIFFYLTSIIFDYVPIVKEKKENLSDIQYSLNVMVKDSHLDEFDGMYLKGKDEITSSYLKRLIFTSLIENGYQDYSQEYYKEVKKLTIEEDNLAYYQLIFKKNNSSSYLEGVNFYSLEEYKDKISKYTDVSYFLKNDYPILNLDNAKKCDEYLRYQKNGEEIYSKVYNGYKEFLSNSIDEMIVKYIPYVEMNNRYDRLADNIFYYRHYQLLIAYLLATLICYTVMPLIFKDGTTLSMKIFKQALLKNSKKRYPFYYVFLITGYHLLDNIFILPMVLFLMYGRNCYPLLVSSLIFNIPLLYLGLFSTFLYLFSIIFAQFKISNKQRIDEIIFRYSVIDKNSFDIKIQGEEDGRERKDS